MAVGRPTISGFTIVRNALRLDYPFAESVRSLLPFCDEVVIACGDSNDGTWELCETLRAENPGHIRLLPTVWDKEKQAGGYQLKKQTDDCLRQLTGDWCFYLQADEVLHEEDVDRVSAAVDDVNADPSIDGVLFDYIHFYGNYSTYILGRNWYRREVRLFKNHRGIYSFRDAQGFRKPPNDSKIRAFPGGARVFHYGHVRTLESLQEKSIEMARWWGKTPDTGLTAFLPKHHVGVRRFQGTHPAVMALRLADTQRHYPDPYEGKRPWTLREFKDAATLVFESVVPYRFGEFRNYERVRRLR